MEEEVLDRGIDEDLPNLVEASKGKRFANYVIDQLINSVIILALYALQSSDLIYGHHNSWWDTLINYVIFVSYYVLFEGLLDGKTPAKYVTNTRVVTVDGHRPDTNSILLRSFSRIVPFDAFSFLGSRPNGWHDRWSNTIVVDEQLSNLPDEPTEVEDRYMK